MVSRVMKPDEFRKLRQSVDYNQSMLAKEMEVTIRTIGRWENGGAPILRTVDLALMHIVQEAKRKKSKRKGRSR